MSKNNRIAWHKSQKSLESKKFTHFHNCWELLLKYGRHSTIHGMDRLLSNSSSKFEKFIWLITLLFGFYATYNICSSLSQTYRETKFETVVDSTYKLVDSVYFPSVTICNLKQLNWQRFDAAKTKFLPNETSMEKLQLFESILIAFDGLSFGQFDRFEVLKGRPLELLNHINFTAVVDLMSWRCEEFLTDCVLNHTPLKCCDIFYKRRSKNGFCWAFNTLECEEGHRRQLHDGKYPWRTGGTGLTNGLNVRVLINDENHMSSRKQSNDKGINVMITEPGVWHGPSFRLRANTKTVIEVEPTVFYFENNTRSVSSAQRECVFENEEESEDFRSLPGFNYKFENCQAACQQEYLIKYCNCTLDHMFPSDKYAICKVTDFLCLSANNKYFRYTQSRGAERYVKYQHEGISCKCLRNCYYLNYLANARSAFLSSDLNRNSSFVDLDVHFRFETMYHYRTTLIFSWIDLLVCYGNIAALFLGCSVISVLELVYFVIVDVPIFLYNF